MRRSVEIKAEVVSDDEREAGRRAILNAGHTVAHALEQVSNYGLPHGEAVALGLVLECELAEQLGLADSGLHRRVRELLAQLGLPDQVQSDLDPTALIDSMTGGQEEPPGSHPLQPPRRARSDASGDGWTTAGAGRGDRAAAGGLETGVGSERVGRSRK